MKSVLETCTPRPEIIAGTFNPEVFTAAIGPILDYYRTGRGTIDGIYTNAELFFKEATYPTQGLRLTLTEVFSRVAGDMTVPAIHRLETSFGGGKTHTLIACAHIAYMRCQGDGSSDNIVRGTVPLTQPGRRRNGGFFIWAGDSDDYKSEICTNPSKGNRRCGPEYGR